MGCAFSSDRPMSENTVERVRENLDAVYRSESRRILATLIRLLGDFDLAEDALHDAFRAALEKWPMEGVPDNPRAWLVSTGRFKAIDAIRKRARQDDLPTPDPSEEGSMETPVSFPSWEGQGWVSEDDMLRLV